MITYLGKKEPVIFLKHKKKFRELLKLFIETQAKK